MWVFFFFFFLFKKMKRVERVLIFDHYQWSITYILTYTFNGTYIDHHKRLVNTWWTSKEPLLGITEYHSEVYLQYKGMEDKVVAWQSWHRLHFRTQLWQTTYNVSNNTVLKIYIYLMIVLVLNYVIAYLNSWGYYWFYL